MPLMRTLPRHLILAAIVLTVCCAERQVTLSTPELAQVAAEMARGNRSGENRSWRRAERQVPAAAKTAPSTDRPAPARPPTLAAVDPLVESDRQVLHDSYPPSRFRLPPPVSAC